ncbi:MAG: Trm112 family protein [Hyphomicrobiaceae bacterium]|nr:Trm112 family protein [Hyphomicrobiaceae bacterium]
MECVGQKKAIDRHLLDLLVCPITKSSLEYNADRSELISWHAQLAFPIVDGIPLLVREASRVLTDNDI